jgi:hypothetical protein
MYASAFAVKHTDYDQIALHVSGTTIEATCVCQHKCHHTAQRLQVSATTWQDVPASSGCLQALEPREASASQAVRVFGGVVAKVAGIVGRDVP